jgi:hypothetical protein
MTATGLDVFDSTVQKTNTYYGHTPLLISQRCQETLHHTRGLAASLVGGTILRWREWAFLGLS